MSKIKCTVEPASRQVIERKRRKAFPDNPVGKPFGYLCPACGEQIYDSQPTTHTDDGLAHTFCTKRTARTK